MASSLKHLTKSLVKSFGFTISRRHPAEGRELAWCLPLGIRTMLDIGANTGQYARYLHENFPEAAIYSFEPLKDCYAELLTTMKGVPRFKAYNCALGDAEGSSVIHHHAYSQSSSILTLGEYVKTIYPFTAEETPETITIKRLDDVLRGLELQDNILIKIDVQGFELQVLRGGVETVRRAKVLIIETSFQEFYDGQALFHDIYEFLRSQGFAYIGSLEVERSPLDGQILQENSVFVHHTLLPLGKHLMKLKRPTSDTRDIGLTLAT